MEMKNKIGLKKAIITSLFIIVFSNVICGVLMFYQYKTYTDNFNKKLNSIVTMIKKEYPNVDKNAVIEILNKEQIENLIAKLRKEIPNVTLRTSLIVGFPGETEEDFEDTLDVVKKVCFEQVFMFIYSRRVGTPGDKMENQIPEEIKHKRFDRLKALVESQIEENNKEYVGTIQKVLIEGKSKTNNKVLTGRTDTNKVVNIEGNENLIGNIVDVQIVSEHMWYLKGEI